MRNTSFLWKIIDELTDLNTGARREVPAMRSCSGPEAVMLDLALVGSLRAPCARGVLPRLFLPVGGVCGMLFVAKQLPGLFPSLFLAPYYLVVQLSKVHCPLVEKSIAGFVGDVGGGPSVARRRRLPVLLRYHGEAVVLFEGAAPGSDQSSEVGLGRTVGQGGCRRSAGWRIVVIHRRGS
jgi:hypothetical protein